MLTREREIKVEKFLKFTSRCSLLKYLSPKEILTYFLLVQQNLWQTLKTWGE